MAPSPSLFDDGKDPQALRTIGEVAKALQIRQHVLRYWEQHFPMLAPLKRSGGRRLYRPEDVELVVMIDRMVNQEGYTLRGARLALENRGRGDTRPASETVDARREDAPGLTFHTPVPSSGLDLIPHLRAIRARLAAALDA